MVESDAAADVRRLDWMEKHPGKIVPYHGNGDGSFPNWHYKQWSGMLSKGHENTLRACIDSAMRQELLG